MRALIKKKNTVLKDTFGMHQLKKSTEKILKEIDEEERRDLRRMMHNKNLLKKT